MPYLSGKAFRPIILPLLSPCLLLFFETQERQPKKGEHPHTGDAEERVRHFFEAISQPSFNLLPSFPLPSVAWAAIFDPSS